VSAYSCHGDDRRHLPVVAARQSPSPFMHPAMVVAEQDQVVELDARASLSMRDAAVHGARRSHPGRTHADACSSTTCPRTAPA